MINAMINSIDDTANADVIELSVPDIYKACLLYTSDAADEL